MKNTALTIQEAKDYLSAEHLAHVLRGELWWSIVPSGDNSPFSFATTGDASPFWSLVHTIKDLGMPIGFLKVPNHLGVTTSQPHQDPEIVLRAMIKPFTKTSPPNMEVSAIRAKYNGMKAEDYHEQQVAIYKAEVVADQARIDTVIHNILAQEGKGLDTVQHIPQYDADGNIEDYIPVEHQGGEWDIPIDRIIQAGESTVKALANNGRVNDALFGAEALIWEQEITKLKLIEQSREHEGAGEGSRAIDNQLLSGSGMAAGMSSGK